MTININIRRELTFGLLTYILVSLKNFKKYYYNVKKAN